VGSNLSYACGPSDTPLMYTTVGRMFDETVARYPDHDAITVCHQDIHWSYKQLKQQVDACAAGLIKLGLKPGERVGIWSPNNIEWVITQFATAKAGLILVNINPAYRRFELEYALRISGCSALIFAEAFKSSDYVAMVQELLPEIDSCRIGELASEKLPDLRLIAVISDKPSTKFLRFSDIAKEADEASYACLNRLADQMQPDEPINIQFTSGTTGVPKGATLSHHNIVNNGYFVAKRQKFTDVDKLCIPVPLYHCFGMVMGVLGCVSHGASMVFPSEAFEAEATLKAIAREKCTALYGVPTMFIAELDEPTFFDHDLSQLRTGVMAGSPCPAEVMKRVIKDMHMKDITIAYGMTETSPVSFQSAPDGPFDKRVSSVGKVMPFVEVKIIDEAGHTLARGNQGELVTRGYSVMQGYWGDKTRTAEAIDAAGWMHTGDLAVMDAHGYAAITGRLKDMIIRGGENIYPREIEEFLYTHPAIADAQVFGLPDTRLGETVAVWVKLKTDQTLNAHELRDFCEGQIAHYKIPAYIKFVQDFPMTVTGKIRKFVMREQTLEEFKKSDQAERIQHVQ